MSVLSSLSHLKTILPVAAVALSLAAVPAFAQHRGGGGGGGGGGHAGGGGGGHGGSGGGGHVGGGGGHGGGGWHGGGGGWHGGGWHGGGWGHGGWGRGWYGGYGIGFGFYPWYGYGGYYDPFWAYGYDPGYAYGPSVAYDADDYDPGPAAYDTQQQYYPPATGPDGLPSDNSRGFYTWRLGVEGGTCNRPELQRIAVNLTGAQPASLQAGSVLGGIPVQRVIGGRIGPRLDVTDQACAAEALEHAQTGTTVRWETTNGIPVTFQVTKSTDSGNNQPCRDFEATAQFASHVDTVRNTACKSQDGAWRATRQTG